MEIVVVSDSHGASEKLLELERLYPHADAYLHCGDLEDECSLYPKWIFVRGNNDYFASEEDMPSQRVVSIGNHKIFMCHSHLFPFYHREEAMIAKAKEYGCDIVLYGHTHRSDLKQKGDMVIMNPGSIYWPRDGKEPSYGLITEKDGELKAQIIHEKRK